MAAPGRAEKETGAGADGRTGPRISGGRPDEGAGARTDGSSNDSPGRRILVGHVLRGQAYLLSGPLPAKDIFRLELLERFPLGGQYQDTWPCGQGRTPAQGQQRQQGDWSFHRRYGHGSLPTLADLQGQRPSATPSGIFPPGDNIPLAPDSNTGSEFPLPVALAQHRYQTAAVV